MEAIAHRSHLWRSSAPRGRTCIERLSVPRQGIDTTDPSARRAAVIIAKGRAASHPAVPLHSMSRAPTSRDVSDLPADDVASAVDRPSKTRRKAAMHELQDLGEALVALDPAATTRFMVVSETLGRPAELLIIRAFPTWPYARSATPSRRRPRVSCPRNAVLPCAGLRTGESGRVNPQNPHARSNFPRWHCFRFRDPPRRVSFFWRNYATTAAPSAPYTAPRGSQARRTRWKSNNS